MAAVAAAAIAPPAVTMNLRRSVIGLASSHRDELMMGSFRDVVPRALLDHFPLERGPQNESRRPSAAQ